MLNVFCYIVRCRVLKQAGQSLSPYWRERKVRTPQGSEPDNIRAPDTRPVTTSATENKPAVYDRLLVCRFLQANILQYIAVMGEMVR